MIEQWTVVASIWLSMVVGFGYWLIPYVER
jgi:hypothetical protein